jgi:threonine aldolase
VFVEMPEAAIVPLQEEFGFYLWNAERRMARLMVSWDTSEETIDAFLQRAQSTW